MYASYSQSVGTRTPTVRDEASERVGLCRLPTKQAESDHVYSSGIFKFVSVDSKLRLVVCMRGGTSAKSRPPTSGRKRVDELDVLTKTIAELTLPTTTVNELNRVARFSDAILVRQRRIPPNHQGT